ncbi:MAG: MBL fold metallo-hydrolase [Haloarculaceae archaeon]
MRVTFLGTGSAMPTGERAQTGLLLDGDEPLLVDCGSGVLQALARTNVGYEGVGTVLLTHHHVDHVSDLLPLLKARWLAGEEHLRVVGPAGTRDLLAGLLDVFDYLQGRVDLQVEEIGPDAPFEVAGFDVAAHETRHSMYCLAYRLSRGSETLTFSADTEAFPDLVSFADGSAVLIHDCSFPDEVDVSNHPTPTQLGEALAAADADVGRVYLTHLYPHVAGRQEDVLTAIGDRYDGDVRFARDGLTIDISAR